MRLLICGAGLLIAVFGGAVRAESTDDQTPPNIVIVYTDDQGWADVGVFGAEGFSTPNLDRLAQQGRRFTNFYVTQPVCSASRAGLLTGCYPNRIGIHGALGPKSQVGIGADETTLAEICKQRGYATAVFGKWHLGHHHKFLPLQHGFDEYYGLPYSNDMWPLHPDLIKLPKNAAERKRRYPPLPIFEGNEIVDSEVTPEDQTQITTALTERAVSFIDRNKDRPFFLYVPHPQPHVPLFVSDKHAGLTSRGLYGDVITEIDWSVGQIMEALERNGLTDRTLVIYASDNGPWLSYGEHGGSAGHLREGKGTTFEGGIRVPCIMRWPGRVPSESVCDEPVMTIDLLPTIAKLVGAELPERPIDGLDVWPILAGEPDAKNPHEAYFFYYRRGDLEAMRSGRWKLHFPHAYRTLAGRQGGTGGTPVGYQQARTGLELYDLSVDPSETTDVADVNPEVVERLSQMAAEMRQDLGDQLLKVKGAGVRPPGRL